FVLMTRDAHMFLTGPRVVAQAMGERVDAATLGGARVHERNGVSLLVGADDAEAIRLARALLSYLPQSAHEPSAPRPRVEEHVNCDPGACVPLEPRSVYDVRDVIASITDEQDHLELGARWARNMVTTLARIEGHAVGVVANQPRHLGGTIDALAAQKAARFVRTCNAYGLPLVVLVDTPGFLPGVRQETGGVIRHGAKLLHAFAEATVPKLTVVLRKAFGGAYITMSSRDLGADLAFAWPDAQIGVMAAAQAVGIISRREIEADACGDVHQRLAHEYAEEHLGATVAAAQGFIDEVIAPGETRERLAWGLTSLSRQRRCPVAGNIQL
ncbi:MAG: acyl-CoA carboxylase subunit beta, partial [Solirubrobacteraceae bacterium]